MKYEIIEPLFEGAMTIIKRTSEDGSELWIPADENNSDYQAYLAYLAEQETA